LTSSVHVSFPQHFPPMNRAIHDRSPGLRQAGLREAFVLGLDDDKGRNKNKARIK
jgi:hypothetical protein